VERWSGRIAWTALALAVGWLGLGLVSRVSAFWYSRGPVASTHAAWDAQCSACHNASSPDSLTLTSLWQPAQRWRDFSCHHCHSDAPHHATLKDSPQCADCHHDHRGRDASLVRLEDSACTRCHQNLSAHSSSPSSWENRVTDFNRDHPEFRKLDPAKPPHERHLKFSHSVHMTPGMAYAGGAKQAKKLKDLADGDRERYRRPGQKDEALVELNCASCHQLDSESGSPQAVQRRGQLGDLPAEPLLPPRAGGP
jgi:hypothetical protein